MTGTVQADVERFREMVACRFGLAFDDGKLAFLADVLRRRSEARGGPSSAYLSTVESASAWRDEQRALASELTVPETYFFRHADQLRAFVERAVPDRTRGRPADRVLRILCAGCASGEEAYSLAMVLRDAAETVGCDESIRGIDVNGAMLARAVRGRYAAWSLRETPHEMRERWFRPEGREFVLADEIRASVSFEERNLMDDDPAFWREGAFDVIFCRNVLMYLHPAAAQRVVRRFASALAPDGYLFLGHAETLRGVSQDFHLCHTHDTFYYRRREDARPASAPPGRNDASARAGEPLVSVAEAADSWVEAIRAASERIEALAAAGTRRPHAEGVTNGWDVRPALEMLRQERFAEARAAVQALPDESRRDPDVLLLRAVLLTHGGDLAEAERICATLLDRDEMSAGAHYLTALCREHAGDRRGAIDHDQTAAYLDPGFAMPRLHLGRLARRAGDVETARRELGQALLLLRQEDASRLLLFGGGFGRDALVTLCKAEILACGGEP